MSDEEKLQDSLAAWVPPWQRATATTPVQPETEPVTASAVVPEADGDIDATAPVTVEDDVDEADGDSSSTGDEDEPDYTEVQQPETDSYEGVSPEAQLLEEFDLDVESPSDAAEEPKIAEEPEIVEEPDSAADEEPITRRPDDLRGALEAILLVVDEPVSDEMLSQVLDAPAAEIDVELRALAAEYDQSHRGFELRRAAGGWRLYTRGDYSAYVERFVLDGQSIRLTQAALETLAVVAYQQPVTRSRMSAIRGVNCDGVVRTLVTRGLIEECGTHPESGAFLYRTTQLFLEKLGLDSIDELPPLAPFLPDDVNGLVDAER